MNCISATGRRPMCAAPAAAPTIAASAIGVSMTRCSPKLGQEPLGHLEGAAVHADVLAEEEDALVALHLFPQGLADGLEVGDLSHRASGTIRAPARAGSAYTPSSAVIASGNGSLAAPPPLRPAAPTRASTAASSAAWPIRLSMKRTYVAIDRIVRLPLRELSLGTYDWLSCSACPFRR